MTTTDAHAMSMNTDNAANDLTQLSSREQLSALMDGALPPDQTRFLLRRLQHDAPLGECWERWRLAGEAMRGLAPAQRLPADFAARVSHALHGTVEPVATRVHRSASWLRWGGGMAMAASLAVVALVARQPGADTNAPSEPVRGASAPASTPALPAGNTPSVPAPVAGEAVQPLLAATAAAATVRPRRDRATVRRAGPQLATTARDGLAAAPVVATELPIPQPDIVTRPWPRSVLPQYASGGLAVGFGDHAHGGTAYNPFASQAGIGTLPPLANPAAATGAGAAPVNDAQREPQP
jgi:negative regulator of sigma E activity